MKKRTQKKLVLGKETVKNLQATGLPQVAGGKPYSYWTDCEYCYTWGSCGEFTGCHTACV